MEILRYIENIPKIFIHLNQIYLINIIAKKIALNGLNFLKSI